jgi:hypothetical protein
MNRYQKGLVGLFLLFFNLTAQAQNNLPAFEELQKLQILHSSDQMVYNQWSKSLKIKELQNNPEYWADIKNIVLLDFLSERVGRNREGHKSFESDSENPMKAPPSEAEIQRNQKKKVAFYKNYLANIQKIKLIDAPMFQKYLKKLDADEIYNRSQLLNMISTEIKEKKMSQVLHQKNLLEFLNKQGFINQENYANAKAQLQKNVAFEGDEMLALLNNYFQQSPDNQSFSFNERYYEIAKRIPDIEPNKLRYEIYKKLIDNNYGNEPYYETQIRTYYKNLNYDFAIYNEDSTTLSPGTLINYFNILLARTQSVYRFGYMYLNGNYDNVKNVLLTQKQYEAFEKAQKQKLILSPFYLEYVDFKNYFTAEAIQKNLNLCRQNGMLKQFSAAEYKKYSTDAMKIETLDFAQVLQAFPGIYLDLQKTKPFQRFLENIKFQLEGKIQITDIIDETQMDSTGLNLDYGKKSKVSFKMNQKEYKIEFDPEGEIYMDQTYFLDLLVEAMDENQVEGNLYDTQYGMGVIFLLPEQARFLREAKLMSISIW